MKAELGISPDTSFNNEIIVLRKTDFFKVLRSVVQEDETLEKNYEAMMKEMELPGKEEGEGDLVRLLLDGTFELLDKVTPLPMGSIREILKLVYARARKTSGKKAA